MDHSATNPGTLFALGTPQAFHAHSRIPCREKFSRLPINSPFHRQVSASVFTGIGASR